jgi:aryl-alcohol dehydrogenase-like predicted oxidoreductase
MPNRRHLIRSGACLAASAVFAPLLQRYAWAAAAPLLTRKIPSSGESLPAIGLGTSQVFNAGASDEELAPLLEVVKTLFADGGSVIDTAPSYGAAEQVTGELLKRSAQLDKAFIATKISATGRKQGLAQFNASQQALQRRKIDLLQVHNLQDVTAQLVLLRELKQQGSIRYIGITHYVEAAHDDLIAVLEREKNIDFVQFNYSVGERGAEKRLLPYCADHGVATLINRPFQRATLLGQVKDKPLPGWAAELQATTWAQLLLKFVLSHPAVTVVIPATSKARYMAENLAAGSEPLPDQTLHEKIAQAFA